MGGIGKRFMQRILIYSAVVFIVLFSIPGCTTDLYESIEGMVNEEATSDDVGNTGDGDGTDGDGSNGGDDGDGDITYYTVTYDANGADSGSMPVDNTNYEPGQLVTVLGNTGNLVKAGHTFTGWNTVSDGSRVTYTQGQTFAMGTADVTLYVRWTQNPTYTVTYDANGADSGSVPVDNTNYEPGQMVTVLGNTGNLLKAGFTFAGWNTASDGSDDDYTQGHTFAMGSADVTLYAIWGGPGYKRTFTADDVSFTMAFVPEGITIHTGVDDGGDNEIVNDAYWIGETEVTYELWSTVYTWATSNGYSFANPGRQGGDENTGPVGTNQHPVTEINWRDAMVLCNAVTEWYNAKNSTSYVCVYKDEDTPIRDSTVGNAAQCDGVEPDSTADGFRLLTSMEWELAARYIKDDGDKVLDQTGEYYPGDYASGADRDYEGNGSDDLDGDGDEDTNDEVAVYNDGVVDSTAEVKSKKENALCLYDISGNVWEWCFDWHPDYVGSNRVLRGGSWYYNASGLQVGYMHYGYPYTGNIDVGFRLARTQ